MSWGFEPGRVYNRRVDIHTQFGGQQQGGIISPANHPIVFIITGEEGLQHGYADRFRSDGVFEYFGEGQVGDMTLNRGNKAIADHSIDGKSLLLFRKTKDGLRFEGEFVCETHHTTQAPDRNGTSRKALVFELRPLGAVIESAEAEPPPLNFPLEKLRQLAFDAGTITATSSKTTVRTVFERSRDVRNYVLARAKGYCEGCSAPAPFNRPNGTAYLEPHHIRRVSDGGPDHPAFVIALCPNCHRRVHAGEDGSAYNTMLLSTMKAIEPA